MATSSDVFYGFCTFWSDDWKGMREQRVLNGGAADSIPCCPFCGSVGFEIPKTKWLADAARYEAAGHPGYVAMVMWGKGRCFPNYSMMEAAWRAANTPPPASAPPEATR